MGDSVSPKHRKGDEPKPVDLSSGMVVQAGVNSYGVPHSNLLMSNSERGYSEEDLLSDERSLRALLYPGSDSSASSDPPRISKPKRKNPKSSLMAVPEESLKDNSLMAEKEKDEEEGFNLVRSKADKRRESRARAKRERESKDNSLVDNPPKKKPVRSTFAEAIDSLVLEEMVIVNDAEVNGSITEEQLLLLREWLTGKLEEVIKQGRTPPRFSKFRLKGGYVIVNCDNEDAKAWLRVIVPLSRAWAGSSLRAISKRELPKIHKAFLWIPGKVQDPKSVLERLNVFNQGLDTGTWRLYNTLEKNKPVGQTLVLGIDENSLKFLKTIECAPYYGMERVNLYIQSKTVELDTAGESMEVEIPSAS